MGGAGHMLHAIKSLKANRDLLKKRTMRKESDYKRIIDAEKPVYKKATPQEMRAIKFKIKEYKKKELLINVISFVLALLILFFIIWYMIN